MHVGSVMVFQPPREGFDHDQLVRIIESRIGAIPRFRQKVLDVPGRIANPVWVDDEAFDMGYHVPRPACLPRPGSDRQLQDFVARVLPRKLDRNRSAVGGLPRRGPARRPVRDRHQDAPCPHRRPSTPSTSPHVIVDAVKGEDLDDDVAPWEPSRRRVHPSSCSGRVVVDTRCGVRPRSSDLVRGGLNDALNVGLRAAESAGQVLSTVARTAARPAPRFAPQRRDRLGPPVVMIATDLDDYRLVRKRWRVARTPRT